MTDEEADYLSGVGQAVADLLTDARKDAPSIHRWSISCGTTAYEDYLEAIRPHIICHPREWPPDMIIIRSGEHLGLFEDPDLPLSHITLTDRDDTVRGGLVLVRP